MQEHDHTARVALERMNLRPVALASRYAHVLQTDLKMLAAARTDDEQKKYEARCVELCSAYGLQAEAGNTKPFAFASGFAVIPVHGTLINRFGSSWGYVTGYNYLTRMVAAAGLDPDVKAIIYDVNTYGGEAAGCFECSREMKRLANGKPTMAVIDSNCYSAGMAIASSANKIVSIPSGGAGSIGVVAMHVSMEGLLKEWGIKITFIHSGEHKVDGNPFEDLPEDVRDDIQADVDDSREEFAQLIADHRGLNKKDVMNTEARCYSAKDALKLGLIDAIATPSAAVQGFSAELSGSNPQLSKKGNTMSDDTTKPEANAATEQKLAEARQAAAKAERERVAGIQNCEEAKGRAKMAAHLALNTSMSVEDAKALLNVAPKEEAAAPATNNFAQRMDADRHPNVGADAGEGGEGEGEGSAAQRILKSQTLATGYKFDSKAH